MIDFSKATRLRRTACLALSSWLVAVGVQAQTGPGFPENGARSPAGQPAQSWPTPAPSTPAPSTCCPVDSCPVDCCPVDCCPARSTAVCFASRRGAAICAGD